MGIYRWSKRTVMAGRRGAFSEPHWRWWWWARSSLPERSRRAQRPAVSRSAASPCLLPFPNNLFTVKDPSSATGLRVSLPQNAMPTNTREQPDRRQRVQPQRWLQPRQRHHRQGPRARQPDRLQQHEPGPARRHVEGLQDDGADRGDRRCDAPAAPDLGRARLERWRSAANTTLLIHPGKNFVEGHRYIVALRNLKNASREHAAGAELVRKAPGQQGAPCLRAVAEAAL